MISFYTETAAWRADSPTPPPRICNGLDAAHLVCPAEQCEAYTKRQLVEIGQHGSAAADQGSDPSAIIGADLLRANRATNTTANHLPAISTTIDI